MVLHRGHEPMWLPEMCEVPMWAYTPRMSTVRSVPDLFTLVQPAYSQWKLKTSTADQKNSERGDHLRRHSTTETASLPRSETRVSTEPWETTIKVSGFKPSDLLIFKSGRTLSIKGYRWEGDEDSGLTNTEYKRNFKIPEDVILPSVKVEVKEGEVIVSALKIFSKTNASNPAGDLSKTLKEHCVEGEEKEENNQQKMNTEENAESDEVQETSDNANQGEEEATEECKLQKEEKEKVEKNVPAECQQKTEENGNAPSTTAEHKDCETHESEVCEPEVKHEEISESHGVLSQEEKEVDDINTCAKNMPEEIATSSNDEEDEVIQQRSAQTEDEIVERKPITWSVPVHGFNMEDVKVRLVDDEVCVTAERLEEKDGVTFVRRMEKCFPVPQYADPDTLTSRYSDDGKLTIEAMPL